MKESPILFSAPMVRALLDGSKTQTRRIVKLAANAREIQYWAPPSGRSQAGWADPGVNYWTPDPSGETSSNHIDPCPYGQPGDRLWVRETWAAFDADWLHPGKPHDLKDGPWPNIGYAADKDLPEGTARPSIHMPRWASRILLEVTGVRVERIKQISEADCYAEGIDTESDEYSEGDHYVSAGSPVPAARYAFNTLWRRTYGDKSWDENPWVWVIEFKSGISPASMKTK